MMLDFYPFPEKSVKWLQNLQFLKLSDATQRLQRSVGYGAETMAPFQLSVRSKR